MDTAIPALFGLCVFGLICMIVMPREWQNVQGWAIMSFLIIPGVLLAISFPMLIFALLFFAGVFATTKR